MPLKSLKNIEIEGYSVFYNAEIKNADKKDLSSFQLCYVVTTGKSLNFSELWLPCPKNEIH